MTNRRIGLSILLSLIVPLTGCVSGDFNAVVAPNLGKTTDCVEWRPIPDDSAAWIDSNPKPPPPSFREWALDWLQGQVKPKLVRDCQ